MQEIWLKASKAFASHKGHKGRKGGKALKMENESFSLYFLVRLISTRPMKERKLSPRHQKFAELLVEGRTAVEAYMVSFPGSAKSTAKTEGSRLQRVPKIAEFIAQLRAELAEKVKSKLIVTLQEALEFLTEVIRTPAGQVTENHRLCQTVYRARKIVVKMPCKLRALELAMKLQGFFTEKVEHEVGDTLEEFLADIRAGRTE